MVVLYQVCCQVKVSGSVCVGEWMVLVVLGSGGGEERWNCESLGRNEVYFTTEE